MFSGLLGYLRQITLYFPCNFKVFILFLQAQRGANWFRGCLRNPCLAFCYLFVFKSVLLISKLLSLKQ